MQTHIIIFALHFSVEIRFCWAEDSTQACMWIFVALIHDSCEGHTQTHTHTYKEAQGTRNSVVFVLSELCLFKGGLVCESGALNNN